MAPRGRPASTTGPKPRKILAYSRTSVACGPCRRRKIRCVATRHDPRGRCYDCIRLNKVCTYSVVQNTPRPVPAAPPQQQQQQQETPAPDAVNPAANTAVLETVALDTVHFAVPETVGPAPVAVVQEMVMPADSTTTTTVYPAMPIPAAPLVHHAAANSFPWVFDMPKQPDAAVVYPLMDPLVVFDMPKQDNFIYPMDNNNAYPLDMNLPWENTAGAAWTDADMVYVFGYSD